MPALPSSSHGSAKLSHHKQLTMLVEDRGKKGCCCPQTSEFWGELTHSFHVCWPQTFLDASPKMVSISLLHATGGESFWMTWRSQWSWCMLFVDIWGPQAPSGLICFLVITAIGPRLIYMGSSETTLYRSLQEWFPALRKSEASM